MLSQSFFARGITESAVVYCSLAGFIAAWSISTAIAVSELLMGLPIGTFYAILGATLGLEGFAEAAYLSFGLHLLTGILLGAAIGFGVSHLVAKALSSQYRLTILGMVAGIIVWTALFIPLTFLFVQPAIFGQDQIANAGLTVQIAPFGWTEQFVWGIALGAIGFHLMWGAIFGYVASSLMRIRTFHIAHHKDGGL